MNNHPDSQFIIYQTEDAQTRLEVRMDNETLWLTQKLMAELFQKYIRTINEIDQNSGVKLMQKLNYWI